MAALCLDARMEMRERGRTWQLEITPLCYSVLFPQWHSKNIRFRDAFQAPIPQSVN
jgi:hypothetical protein